jgi:signal transduction histidine kinase
VSDDSEARARRLSELAAGAAHGLNNLLGGVAGQASQLLDDAEAVDPASETARGLRLIQQAALDGVVLARRLLRSSRRTPSGWWTWPRWSRTRWP